ncbi:MAG: DUF2889 domain-containing protein [Peptococcaceae bacterium]|nr:DUF2889 domain-containing protein [Peptococcaceae bacterium]
MILSYVRNKHATAVDRPDGTVLARAAVEETSFAARVELVVTVPGLEISSVEAAIDRCFPHRCREAVSLAQKAAGLRVGPGIIKLVNGEVGGPGGCPRLADLILECCDQVILRFTVDPLKSILDKKGQEMVEAYKLFLAQNPRLANSCIAFAEGSPLREGVDLEE